jgi:UPF0755 protein
MLPIYQIERPKRSVKRIVFLAVFLLLVLGGAFTIYANIKIHRPASTGSETVTFSVPKGATTSDVAGSLEEKRLISGSTLFVLYAKFTGVSGKIQAGDYMLNTNMSMKQIAETLASGKVTRNVKRVVILEGWTNSQVQGKLKELGLVTDQTFTDAVSSEHGFAFAAEAKLSDYEGYLFPDTYQFDADLDAGGIIQAMLSNFEGKITDQMLFDMKTKNLSMKEVVTMASLIESEVGRAASVQLTSDVRATMQREREIVASVFYNRLGMDMALQSDATINYITRNGDRRAQLSDLEIDSPYNTYKYTGLPPGPISNPGIDSIRAAIYPADSSYVYFLHDPSGVAYFARTLEEHNSNREKYLE